MAAYSVCGMTAACSAAARPARPSKVARSQSIPFAPPPARGLSTLPARRGIGMIASRATSRRRGGIAAARARAIPPQGGSEGATRDGEEAQGVRAAVAVPEVLPEGSVGGAEGEVDWGIAVALGLAAAVALGVPQHALADAAIDPFFSFNPVCPAADGVFRAGQRTALAIAGDNNIQNYRPLINDVLIRVRTELCVLESFSRETAVPFVQEKGLGWVLPLHETSETYLAGVVFMIGTNFILLGSTKVVAILSIYHDLALGLPARLLGKFLGLADSNPAAKAEAKLESVMEKQMAEVKKVMAAGKDPLKVSEDISAVNLRYQGEIEVLKQEQLSAEADRREGSVGKALSVASAVAIPFKFYGNSSKVIRNVLEVFDTFCSRYFVTFTVGYIIIKTAHYVFFPDIF